jgi:site-specific recombinase XerD
MSETNSNHYSVPYIFILPCPFFLTKDQVKQMVNWVFEHRKNTAIRNTLIIICAFRSNELISLKIEDIGGNNSIDSEKPKGGDKKKRIVLIDNYLKSWLMTYIRQDGRKRGYLFRSNLKKEISNRSIRDILKIIGKRTLDMDIHPHTLRHSFAIHFLNSTGNLANLKQLLGHSYIKNTEHYLKYILEDILEENKDELRW